MANFLGTGGGPEAVGEDAGQGAEIGKKGPEGSTLPTQLRDTPGRQLP